MVPNGGRPALIICFALAACSADAPTAAGPPAVLQRVSGDGQSARPGETLERPLVARLVDADGHAVRRVEVRWSASTGQVAPEVSMTDGKGETRAVWHLGTAAGEQRAIAIADGLAPIEFIAFVNPATLPDRIPLRAMDIATYDGSGQVVHPDVTITALDGLDDRPRLAITPYPWGNATFENPSLFDGTGRDAWTIPIGVTNPIVKPNVGYLSDPDILWLSDTRELWLFYRHVDSANEILLARSTDGVRWSAPRVVVRAPNHQAVSPTVVRRSATEWLMWTVNAGSSGCTGSATTVELRRSVDGVDWSPPATVGLTQAGAYPWHLEVQWIPALREYWAMFNGKVAGSCTTDALYIATSADGVTWRTFRSPVLRRGAIPELADVVYRATFSYDPQRDLVSLWHSGARYTNRGYEWHAAFERRLRSEVFETITRADAAISLLSTSPPLTNATAP